MNESQYDAIGRKYDLIKTIPFNRLEQFNFRAQAAPFLASGNATIIDFACGTGFYSERLIRWGGAYVMGIDISKTMVELATARLANASLSSRSCFVQGDGTHPTQYYSSGSEGFDIATGVWFLNYARDMNQLTAMFRSIATNLKSTGVFVGVCLPPTDDIDSIASASCLPALSRTGVVYDYAEKLEGGIGYRVHVFAVPKEGSSSDFLIDFWTYHLRKDIFAVAARMGGMNGYMEWRPCVLLGEEWRNEIGLDYDDEGWRILQENPLLGVLVIRKQ